MLQQDGFPDPALPDNHGHLSAEDIQADILQNDLVVEAFAHLDKANDWFRHNRPNCLFNGRLKGWFQGIFDLEPRKLCIGIEIEIVIEIDFWQLSDFDSDSGDFDFDGFSPFPGGAMSTL
ncbi:hypothetical protein [Desulfonatronum thiodismutans]|uniref:hypothetical protein n=1 Tax=Desulfonatronum thiodismutans TaxID=159290 RepID=UPI001F31B95B|nr:hypothetical protein [Desulfonatronum thiodismutans]